MRTARAVFAVCLTIACGAAVESIAAAKPQSPEYHLLKKVSLGGEGRWDYFAVEPGTHRVFIPRRTHIMVLDPEGKVLDDLKFPGMENAHGIVFAPELKRAFTTNGDDKSVTIFNPDTLKLIETVKLPDRAPDGILYDPASKRVFTQNDDPNTDATAIDAKTGKVLGNIPLPDKAETAQADGEGHVYVNIPWLAISSRFQPAPIPNSSRPPERWSTDATSFAVVIGSRSTTRQMPLPIRSVDVASAAAVSATNRS